MNDSQLLIDPFLEKWRGKYPITWCDECDVAIIICPHCHNSSCNGGGCDICINDQDAKDFMECNRKIQDYLNEADKLAYEKALRIKRHILDTLSDGEKTIDWEKKFKEGKLNEYETLWFR